MRKYARPQPEMEMTKGSSAHFFFLGCPCLGLVLAGLLRPSPGALGLARGFASSMAGAEWASGEGGALSEEDKLDKELEDPLLTLSGSGPATTLAFTPMSRGWCRGMLLYTRLAAGTHKVCAGGWEVGNRIPI